VFFLHVSQNSNEETWTRRVFPKGGESMRQPRARITTQLGIALAIILAVVISLSTAFALQSLDKANLATREEHLGSEARLLADQLSTFHSTLRDSTQRLSGLFERRFTAGLAQHPEQSIQVGSVQTPALQLGDEVLNNTFTEVASAPPSPSRTAAAPSAPCSTTSTRPTSAC
jgi:hypothetical protein